MYERRIKSYTELLWKLQFSHNIYINLDLKPEDINHKTRKIKAYVGSGNNSAMIRGLLKRRYWWTFSDDKSECSFVWTQIKINAIFEKQKRSPPIKPNLKKEEEKILEKNELARKSQSLTKKSTIPLLCELYNYKVFNDDDQEYFKRYVNRFEREKERTYEFKYDHCPKVLHQ